VWYVFCFVAVKGSRRGYGIFVVIVGGNKFKNIMEITKRYEIDPRKGMLIHRVAA
jgi:hypothetical protein